MVDISPLALGTQAVTNTATIDAVSKAGGDAISTLKRKRKARRVATG